MPGRSVRFASAARPCAHPLLALSTTPVLDYDLTLPPTTLSANFPGLSSAGLLEPAVYPPHAALTLATSHLPWAVGVIPADARRGITVADVLAALYAALRANVTSAEFSALGTQRHMRRAVAAYRRRCERLRGRRAYEEEKAQGMKRVDFLMGCTKFCGIAPRIGAPGVWTIHIG
ncbi:hypothetical protein B0H15DRAFT_803086 [Mycena belliarum]|uniref:DUF6699 domain-containing protein n=1 Tax=Mycena belliarum TaxID=1033014 RepID=A0AAD6TXB1_9AGAR|nr:hypothetical protein B0H15DRAFT_803086 [Mycena belliae]